VDRQWQFSIVISITLLNSMVSIYGSKNLGSSIMFYGIVTLLITILWAMRFLNSTKSKDMDFIFFAGCLLIVTFFFFLRIFLASARRRLLLSVLIPCLTVISSMLIGVIFLMIASLRGTPMEMILVYGVVYLLTNILVSISIPHQYRK
jgi:hypothetical protein